MTLTDRLGIKSGVLDKYEPLAIEKYPSIKHRITKDHILKLCAEGDFDREHIQKICEYMDYIAEKEDVKQLIWLHFYLRFESEESYFDNLWQGGLEDIPTHKESEEKFSGYFITVVYILAAEHLKKAAKDMGFDDEIVSEYYHNFKRFANMNLISHNTYGLVRLASFLYCYAYPTICRVGRFNFQIVRFKDYLDVYENNEGKRFLAARDTYTYNADGLQDEYGAFRPKILTDGSSITAHTFDSLGRLTKERYTVSLSEYRRVLTEGDIVLTVHIPEGERMTPELTVRSLCDAECFFREKFGGWNISAVVCQTWFLDPALRSVFGENSNISFFQSLFDIAVGPDQGLHSLFEHIFKTKPAPLNTLMPKNRLQSEMLERAKQGVKMYWAYGILKRDYKNIR